MLGPWFVRIGCNHLWFVLLRDGIRFLVFCCGSNIKHLAEMVCPSWSIYVWMGHYLCHGTLLSPHSLLVSNTLSKDTLPSSVLQLEVVRARLFTSLFQNANYSRLVYQWIKEFKSSKGSHLAPCRTTCTTGHGQSSFRTISRRSHLQAMALAMPKYRKSSHVMTLWILTPSCQCYGSNPLPNREATATTKFINHPNYQNHGDGVKLDLLSCRKFAPWPLA